MRTTNLCTNFSGLLSGRRSVKGKPFYCWRSAKTTLYQKQRLSAPTKAGAACRRPKSFLRKDHGEESEEKFMLEPKLRQQIRQKSGRHTRIFFLLSRADFDSHWITHTHFITTSCSWQTCLVMDALCYVSGRIGRCGAPSPNSTAPSVHRTRSGLRQPLDPVAANSGTICV